MNTTMQCWWGTAWAVCACCATAQTSVDEVQTPADSQTEIAAAVEVPAPKPQLLSGDATRQLLRTQAQGDSASSHQYPMSGAVAQKTFERYVNSFAHPIPEHSASTIGKSSK
jgi:hypothetical protein